MAAVKSLFDSLIVHGLMNFCSNDSEDKQKKSKPGLNTSGDSTSTVVPSDDSDLIESQKDPEERKDEFIKLLSDHLVELLRQESGGVRLVAVQGIAKLMIHGRIFSPMLLGRMIILWYHPETENNVRQFIGKFLPIYAAYKHSRSGLSETGQNAFEETFLEVLEEVYYRRYVDREPEYETVNLDNMVDFMFSLMTSETQGKVSIPIAHRILMFPDDSDLGYRFLLRALERVSLDDISLSKLRELIHICKKIQTKYEDDRIPSIATKRLSKVIDKLEEQKRILKQSQEDDPDATLVPSSQDGENKENELFDSRASSRMDQDGDNNQEDDTDIEADGEQVEKGKKESDPNSDTASNHSQETDDPNQALSSDEQDDRF